MAPGDRHEEGKCVRAREGGRASELAGSRPRPRVRERERERERERDRDSVVRTLLQDTRVALAGEETGVEETEARAPCCFALLSASIWQALCFG